VRRVEETNIIGTWRFPCATPLVEASQTRAAAALRATTLLSGLGFGLILTVVPMALVNHVATGVLITSERITLMVLGMVLGAGTAAFRHRRTLLSRVPHGRR